LSSTLPPAPTHERIEFAAFAPQAINPGATFVLDVWAYLANQYSSVLAIAREVRREVMVGRKTGLAVPRGELLTITLNMRGCHVNDPVDTVLWDGVPTNAAFVIDVPADAKGRNVSGCAVVGYQGITIAKIVFVVRVSDHAIGSYGDISGESFYPRTAFASDATEN
jgi:hypothetical protein